MLEVPDGCKKKMADTLLARAESLGYIRVYVNRSKMKCNNTVRLMTIGWPASIPKLSQATGASTCLPRTAAIEPTVSVQDVSRGPGVSGAC